MTTNRITNFIVLFVGIFLAMSVTHAQEPGKNRAEIFSTHKKTLEFLENGQIEEALRSAEHAYSLAQTGLEQNDPSLTPLEMSYSNLLLSVGSRYKARVVLMGTLARVEGVYGKDAIEVLPVLVGLSEVAYDDEQVKAVHRALAIHKKHHLDRTLEYANYALKMGGFLAVEREVRAEAIPILEEALQLFEFNYGKKNEQLIPVLMALGDANARHRKVTAQRKFYDRAIKIAKNSDDKQNYASLLQTAGMHIMQFSASPKARKYLEKAYEQYLALLGPDHFKTANAQLGLARFDVATENHNRAEQNLLSALKIFEQDENLRNFELTTMSLLVESYETMGRRDEATQYCQAIGMVSPWIESQEYRPLFKRIPDYPKDAVQSGREGSVVIEYTVDENGFVTSPKIIKTKGPKSFNKAALAALEGFRYAPRFIDGKPVATPKVRNEFKFNFSD